MTEQPAILITGASSGIGAAFARVFADDGVRLILSGRDGEALARVAAHVARPGLPQPFVLTGDLTEPGAGRRLLADVAAEGLHVDVLVNNAGAGLNGPAAELDLTDQLAIVDLNVRAATELALAVLPDMIGRRRGGILNVASVAGFLPGPFMAVYYASKAFLVSLSQALAEEVRGSGVTVSALCPGPTATDFGRRAGFRGNTAIDAFGSMSADEVARIGHAGFRAGRRLVVPGLRNRAAVALTRIAPRRVALAVIAAAQRRRGESR